jgi:hypothetical protein
MSNRKLSCKLNRLTSCCSRAGATTLVIESVPSAGLSQGFGSWKDRSHAVAGAEGSCMGSREIQQGVPT